jgi:hypothetical protein
MIIVHHLNNSRSQRILWLLEELDTPYRVETYLRDAKTNLAPPELRAVHPLGKSQVIQDGDLVLARRAFSNLFAAPNCDLRSRALAGLPLATDRKGSSCR